MDDRANTIAGWVLGAGIVALGASIVTGEMFHAERPEKMGYPIEGVEVEGEGGDAEAEQPIAAFLQTADVAKGGDVFKKCAACHTITPGGANGLGPNLHGIMGQPVAARPGFAYSDALKSKGGTWGWEEMSAWLLSPKKFAPGTKMTFAGLSKPEDRANILAYMNAQGSNLPLPAAPAAAANPAEAAADAAAKTGPAAKGVGEKEPVLTEAEAAKQPVGRVMGPGAPATSGREEQGKTKGE